MELNLDLFEQHKEYEDEVVSILQDLIRIDTSNPPGNELKAAKYLEKLLSKEGFKCEIFESDENRGNIYTEIKGEDENLPILLLLNHLDVVPANKEKWEVDPFSGDLIDDFIWGRGALDMKGTVAAQVFAVIALKRANIKPKRTIKYLSVADEEAAGNYGAKFMTENHWEKIKATYVICEGGGFKIPVRRFDKYTLQVAEKGPFWSKIKVKGEAAHGSTPRSGVNALTKMSKIITKIDNHNIPVKITKPYKTMINNLDINFFFKFLMKNSFTVMPIINAISKMFPILKTFIEPLVKMNITPTMCKSGTKVNVIPDEAEAQLDCRLLPGMTKDDLMNQLKHILGEKLFSELEIIPIQWDEGSFNEIDNDFYEKISEIIGEIDKDGEVLPFMVPGTTDNRYFRWKGSVAYGFHPMIADMDFEEMSKLAHGKNERISVNNLKLGTEFYYRLIKDF
ncbi:MAG: M20/M25/M40 family metallo-hydrolase [Candidatus Lokiarchaeota archaeon]|nr:M20/M25/M40 family metallo-hydrolase [Candidatus Lokiarchaeota archaeon]